MDLNLLYAEHQRSLLRAMACTSARLRTRHLACAGAVARRIQAWQQAEGAIAASGWALFMDAADLHDHCNQRITA